MSNNKQSSVEWLMEKIATKDSDSFIAMSFYVAFKEEFEQAKAMHKEERISDYYQGACDESDNHGAQYIIRADAERWYNETFGGNNEQQ